MKTPKYQQGSFLKLSCLCLIYFSLAFQNATANPCIELSRDTIPIQKKVSKKITGTVTDEEGNPMPGVSIQIENSDVTSSTDVAGNFEMYVPEEATVLAIAFPGYATNRINIIQLALKYTITQPQQQQQQQLYRPVHPQRTLLPTIQTHRTTPATQDSRHAHQTQKDTTTPPR